MQILVEESDLPTAIQLNHAMSDDEYFEFCAENRDKRIERTAQGDIIILPPAGVESSFCNNEISAELRDWTRKDGAAGRSTPARNSSCLAARRTRPMQRGFPVRGSTN
jgi:Uma2 family endonuclease